MSNAPCQKCELTIKFINVDCVIKTKATHLPKDNNNPTAHIYPGIVISFLMSSGLNRVVSLFKNKIQMLISNDDPH